MSLVNFPIARLNKFFENHIFVVHRNPPSLDYDYDFPTNIKIKITGVKEYVRVGEKTPHLEYTIYILPTNEKSDYLNGILSKLYGKDLQIFTYSREIPELRRLMDMKLSHFLTYFGVDEPVICTRVINEVEPKKIYESIIHEGILDKTTRVLVKDIISFFKHQRSGEFSLPEDLSGGEMVYELPGFNGFSIDLTTEVNENIDGIDVDGNLYYDDGVLEIIIISNPDAGYSNLSELTSELNEVVRHELQHIRQIEQGMKIPKKEPKDPEKYYSQEHELDAQRAGFRKRAKAEKRDFESVVRGWFEKNKNKHKLSPEKAERIIQKLLGK